MLLIALMYRPTVHAYNCQQFLPNRPGAYCSAASHLPGADPRGPSVLLMAVHALDEREDALRGGRGALHAEDHARRLGPRRYLGVVVAPPGQEGLGQGQEQGERAGSHGIRHHLLMQ